MERLRGRGLGAGMALGTAAVVRVHNGVALLPEVPPRLLAEQDKRRSVEPPDLILVAEDYRIAQSVLPSLTWGKVVGIAAGSAAPDTPVPDLPAVVDIPGLMERVQDEMLLLVEAERGVVRLDPDAMAVAQYQAEYEHIAPKRRLFLDDVHLPAQTLDGKTILVIAELDAQAVVAGADALFISLESEEVVFSNETPTGEQRLADALAVAAGKPLFVTWEGSVAPETLLQAAAQIDLTVVIPVWDDPNVITLAAEELRAAETVCQEREVRYGSPHLAAAWGLLSETDWPDNPEQDTAYIESLINQGASRLLVYLGMTSDILLQRFETMIAAAAAALVPVYVSISPFVPYIKLVERSGKSGREVIETLLGAGASGFLVYPSEETQQFEVVQKIKRIIRETNVTECRDMLLQRLSENAGD